MRRKLVLDAPAVTTGEFAGPRPPILVRDNDRLYGRRFRDEVRALGLDDRRTPVKAS